MVKRYLLILCVLVLTACSGNSRTTTQSKPQEIPSTEVVTITRGRIAELEINGRRCILYTRGDNIGGGGGLDCDWNTPVEKDSDA